MAIKKKKIRHLYIPTIINYWGCSRECSNLKSIRINVNVQDSYPTAEQVIKYGK
jgi:hypothetical protein